MAKLENVKILDMVNGEPTRVKYNEAVYEKTEEKAKEGDLVRVIDKDGIGCVTQDGFYETYLDELDELTFVDDDGDERPYEYYNTELETFRKVSETKASADLAERLAELEQRIEALEERMKPTTKEMAAKAESATKFEVGDYAKVVSEGRWGSIDVGNIVKIVAPKDYDDEYKAELLDGSDYDYFRAEQLEKVTEEEVKEIARWAKIGRKPGEFKKGDIVRVIDAHGGVLEDGEIGVLGDKDEDGTFRVFARNVTSGNWYNPTRFELIAPVDKRFDLATEGACQ